MKQQSRKRKKKPSNSEDEPKTKKKKKESKYAIAKQTLERLEVPETPIFPFSDGVASEYRMLQYDWERISSADLDLLRKFGLRSPFQSSKQTVFNSRKMFAKRSGFFWSALAKLNPRLNFDFLEKTNGHVSGQSAVSFFATLEVASDRKDFERATREMLSPRFDVKKLAKDFHIGIVKAWLWLFAEGNPSDEKNDVPTSFLGSQEAKITKSKGKVASKINCACIQDFNWNQLQKTQSGTEMEFYNPEDVFQPRDNLAFEKMLNGDVAVEVRRLHQVCCKAGSNKPAAYRWIVPVTQAQILEDFTCSYAKYASQIEKVLTVVIETKVLHTIVIDYLRKVRVVRKARKNPSLLKKLRCGNCGLDGHLKMNLHCPMYGENWIKSDIVLSGKKKRRESARPLGN